MSVAKLGQIQTVPLFDTLWHSSGAKRSLRSLLVTPWRHSLLSVMKRGRRNINIHSPSVLRILVSLHVWLAQLEVGWAQAVNQSVTCRDPRIQYVGSWIDQDGGGHKYTGDVGASLSFTFQGCMPYIDFPNILY